MKNLNKKISVSIVNFNSGEYLIKCLDSLEKNCDFLNLDIWVVDNLSTDESFKKAKLKYPNLNYIENNENIGFGKAHNQVLKRIKTEYVLILNPDTEIYPKTLEFMISFMDENPDVGASTCKIVLEDTTLDMASHRGFPTPFASLLYFLGDDSLYHLTKKPMNEIHEVDGISGSFFLTRRSVLGKVGLFDEDYFMYAEDLDLCFRIKQKGFKIMFVPKVKILHYKGISSGLKRHSREISHADNETKKRSLNAFYETMKIFYKKHMQNRYPFFINWLVYLGVNLKWFLAKRSMHV